MSVIKLILVAIAMLSVGVFGLAIRIVLKKDGQFPDTHVGHNKEMRKKGIRCAKTFDRAEQEKVKNKLKYKDLRLAK